MIVYKYLKKEHEQLFRSGLILVNTYEGIRKLDIKDSWIPDSKEGTYECKIKNFRIDSTQSKEDNEKNRKKLHATRQAYIDETSSIILDGATLGGIMPNAYMFCVTKEKNDLYWAEKEQYDSCIRILDFKEFVKRLKESINKEHTNLNWRYEHDDCKYIGRDYNFDDMDENFDPYAIDTYFLKPSSTEADFYKQKEYRFVAIPKIQNSIITPRTYQIDKTGLFEDCETETKECHTLQKTNENVLL